MATVRTPILLADDHEVVLDGLKSLLSSEPDIVVVGKATDGRAVLPTVLALKPAIVVLDIIMPGMNGLEILRLIREQIPATKVIVLSMHGNVSYVAEALRNGASGYVLKQAKARTLVEAIRVVRGGARYLSQPISEVEVERWRKSERTAASSIDAYDTLSAREREVMQLAVEGLTSSEIGKKLAIGRRTVETHRANLYRKLGIKAHTELVRFAVRKGLIGID